MHVVVHWQRGISEGHLYNYCTPNPEKIYYIGKAYRQEVGQRIKQELSNPKWRTRLKNHVDEHHGLTKESGWKSFAHDWKVNEQTGQVELPGAADKMLSRPLQLYLETGRLEIVVGGKKVTEKLVNDVEGFLIVASKPTLNIRSKKSHNVTRAEWGLRLENRGSLVIPTSFVWQPPEE